MNFEKQPAAETETKEPMEGADMLNHNLNREAGLTSKAKKMGKMSCGLLAGLLMMTAIGCAKENPHVYIPPRQLSAEELKEFRKKQHDQAGEITLEFLSRSLRVLTGTPEEAQEILDKAKAKNK